MRERRKIFTIVTSGADADKGIFQDPTPAGSYFSPARARLELLRLIAEEKETLDTSRYDTEEQSDTVWYAYLDRYAAGRFVRIEIVTSQLMDEENSDG